MNNPEHGGSAANREPKEVRKSLLSSLKDLIKGLRADQEKTSEEYLEKKAEKPAGQPEIKPEQKAEQNKQKTRLQNLKETLDAAAVPGIVDYHQQVASQARSTAAELGGNTEILAFQKDFYKNLAQARINEEHALPFARYIAATAEHIATSDAATSVRQKAELALEIFVGETGDTRTTTSTLKEIVKSVVESHDSEKYHVARDYFQSQEFKDLCTLYGFSEAQTQEIIEKKKNPDVDLDDDKRPSLQDQKRQLLDRVDDDELRIRLDLELLSLSPDRILTLLRTVEKDKIQEVSGRGSDRAILSQLEGEDGTEKFRKDPEVAKWIDEFFNRQTISSIGNLDPTRREALQGEVRDYFLKVRNELYLSKVKRFPHSPYMGINPYQTWVNQFKDDIIAADLMTGTSDPFLFVEYFRGKIAETIRNHGQVEELVDMFKKGKRFNINEHQIYGEVLRDLKQAWLAQISQTDDQNFQAAARNITTAIARVKQDELSKRDTAFGNVYDEKGKTEVKKGAKVLFEYRFKSEDVDFGTTHTQQRVNTEPTIAHMTAVFPKAMSEFGHAYKALTEFASMAETGGDAEKITGAAKQITNNLIDVAAEQAPIVVEAMQSYLRIFREKLSANGNVLAPDFFASTPYIKDEMMKLLEMEIKNAHPDITDFEREIYLKMGKGLAIASGEFLASLSNALPPMTFGLSSNKLPPEIAAKIKNNETLTLTEIKKLEGIVSPEFKDFPFRGLLMSMNPVKWLYSWIKFNDYNVFSLGFNPYKSGEAALDPADTWDITQKIMFSSFLGMTDDVVKYFDGKHVMPFFELSNMNQKISLEKRAGVRRRVKQLLEGNYVINNRDAKTGLRYIDGEATFRQILHRNGPMLANYFMTDPGAHSGVAVRWENKESDQPSAKLKDQLTAELMDYMHKYYPTFFTSVEQPHFYRRNELSFGQSIRENIRQDLATHSQHDSGYWLFLSERERTENITEKSDPSPLGRKYMHENLIATRRVSERMNVVMQELQTYIQVKSPRGPNGERTLTMEGFFQAPNMETYDKGLSDILNKALGNITNLYSLSPNDSEAMRQCVQKYAQDIHYGEHSVYKTGKYVGNDQNGNSRSISDYYVKLMNDGLLIQPFDWAYFDKTELTYQSTGVNMTGRNIDDFGKIIGYTSKYHGFVGALQDAISKPGKSKDIIKGAIDKIEGSLNGISTSYDAKDAAKAGWMASAYLTYPFIASRWKDIPIAGKLPIIHSWATMVNKDDYRGLNAWDGQTRKEILDGILEKEWSKAILDPVHENQIFEGFETNLVHFKLPIKNADGTNKEFKIPMPRFLQKIIGKKYKKRFDEGPGDFSVKSFKKFLKAESWWLGGRENFGLGYNVLLTVLIIGFLLMFIQAFKEGLKSAESK